MDKRKEIIQTKKVVEYFLETDTKCRCNDNRLYYRVCAYINPDVRSESFANVFNNYNDYGIPSFETIRRSRQKLQEEHEEYRACEVIEEYRAENEEVFREEFS